MNLLALDTSSNACSVALRAGDDIISNHEIRPREHTAILMPMIEETLCQANMRVDDLDAIALGNGPGSFIGMRIGASVTQGMAFGAGLKVIPVSSLEIIAAEVFDKQDISRVVVAQDAHMSEVYLAVYARDDKGMPVAQGDVRLHKITDSFDGEDYSTAVTAGAGWQRYPELDIAEQHIFAGRTNILYPNARYLLDIGQRNWHEGQAIPPDDIVPEYVRMTVAARPMNSN